MNCKIVSIEDYNKFYDAVEELEQLRKDYTELKHKYDNSIKDKIEIELKGNVHPLFDGTHVLYLYCEADDVTDTIYDKLCSICHSVKEGIVNQLQKGVTEDYNTLVDEVNKYNKKWYHFNKINVPHFKYKFE